MNDVKHLSTMCFYPGNFRSKLVVMGVVGWDSEAKANDNRIVFF